MFKKNKHPQKSAQNDTQKVVEPQSPVFPKAPEAVKSPEKADEKEENKKITPLKNESETKMDNKMTETENTESNLKAVPSDKMNATAKDTKIFSETVEKILKVGEEQNNLTVKLIHDSIDSITELTEAGNESFASTEAAFNYN